MGQGPLARRQSSDSQLSFQTPLLPPLIKFAASAEKADSSPGKNAVRNDKCLNGCSDFCWNIPDRCTTGVPSRENQTGVSNAFLPRCRTSTNTVRQRSLISPTQK